MFPHNSGYKNEISMDIIFQCGSFNSRLSVQILNIQTIKYIPASFDYVLKEIFKMKMHPSLKNRRVHEYGKIMSDFK